MATSPSPELHLHHLRPLTLLGSGATGTVLLVHNHLTDPSAHRPFALKLVQKHSPESDHRARRELSVLKILTRNPHPFLPTLIGTIETDEIVSWATPYCSGGDLNVLRHRQMDGVFSPAVIRFYAAEIVCALEHIHDMGIVYRDLKPENILIQGNGHVTLTDFDLSRALSPKTIKSLIFSSGQKDTFCPEVDTRQRKFFPLTGIMEVKLKKAKSARVTPVTRRNVSVMNGERSNSFVGTDEYLAPEVVRGDGHEFAVDWWALGVLCYEMLYGTTPFRGKNRKDTFARILMMDPKFTGQPTLLTDLIKKLLEKEPTCRLGYGGGACEIKEHPFFDGLRWEMLTEVVRPPFIPSRDDTEVKLKPPPGGFDITEYFRKAATLESSSRDESGYNVELTEF